MKTFQATFYENGKKTSSIFRASNKSEALKIAKSLNAKLIKLEEKKDKIFTKKISKPDPLELIASFRQLSIMTNAGIDIQTSIKEVHSNLHDKHLKIIFSHIIEDLNAGKTLTQSSQEFSHLLGQTSIALINLGENIGNLGNSFTKLADILEQNHANKVKFLQAIRYPIIVICVMCVAFCVLMLGVVPKFEKLFSRFDSLLPLPTRILLGIEHFFKHYGLISVFILGSVILFCMYLYKKRTKFKDWFDYYILKFYIIGDLLFYSSMYRFNLIFSELINAGINVNEAMDVALLSVDNTHLHKRLSLVKISISQGSLLHSSFEESKLYNSMLISLIKAGQSSGQVSQMLFRVSEFYKDKFSLLIDNLALALEPILIFFISSMVLLLALGIFMPMWDLSHALKQA